MLILELFSVVAKKVIRQNMQIEGGFDGFCAIFSKTVSLVVFQMLFIKLGTR